MQPILAVYWHSDESNIRTFAGTFSQISRHAATALRQFGIHQFLSKCQRMRHPTQAPTLHPQDFSQGLANL
jgi:hypothetical protein